MADAGHAAFTVLRQKFPSAHKLLIFCGSGNNAGDGYVLARLALEAGYSVMIHQYKPVEYLPPAAANAAVEAMAAGVACQYMDEGIEADADLIVDALLGIGIHGMVKPLVAAAINQINDSGLPVLALDIPSGLDADTGKVMGVCVRATVTVTFLGCKTGMMTLDGPDYCGEIICPDQSMTSRLIPAATILNKHCLSDYLPGRNKNCHKKNFGHILMIGGGEGMPGAISLSAQAAMRSGAGMVTVATRPEYASCTIPNLPEALLYGINEVQEIIPLIQKASVCLIGPGLGTDEWAVQLFLQVIAAQLPMVIDASALHILAENPQQDDNWVLTPHPGEAAALLDTSVSMVQNNRFRAAASLQKKYGGNVVLKGVGSLIRTEEQKTFLCAAGNPGMATAGMGDVLSGVIAGLIAQGMSLHQSACAGVWLHARAADKAAAEGGERGLLASDLMPFIRMLVN